ncbi:MAG: hypothetical protein ACFFAB_06625 [Candidatus Heimdallarchaeota archaeon]
MMGESEDILLEKAKFEEKTYNWKEAAVVYEKLVKEYTRANLLDKAAVLYKRLGFVNSQAADTVGTTEQYISLKSKATMKYREAGNLFKSIGIKAEELECYGEALYEEGCTSTSINTGEKEFKNSLEFFIQASELFSNKGDEEGFTRNIIRSAMCMHNLMKYAKNPKELENIIDDGTDYAEKAWKFSKKLNRLNYLIDSLYAMINISIHNCFLEEMPTFYNLDQGKTLAFDFKKWFNRAKMAFELTKDQSNLKIHGIINFILGFLYFYYGFFLAENMSEQNHNIEEGLILCEKGLDFIRKTKDNGIITLIIFWLNWCAVIGGRINYVQKRIIQDIKEIKEAGKVYSNLFSFWNFYSNFLPALYYTNIAQRSFFGPEQREFYAKEALNYAKASHNNIAFKPFSVWAYQILTWSYSQLVYLAKNEEDRSKYAKSMVEDAENANKVASEYEKGFSRTSGYSALYRSFKTLADVAQNKENKIKMLRSAVDAADNYLDHPVESRTGFIAAKIRLGLLYEELGIISNEKSYLIKAKEVYLNAIEDSLNRGHISYAAASHEYIARIEDRLGNYKASAEYYDKAQKDYQESLSFIEYKLLKDRIHEKKNYSLAWKLIENAKAYHKKEDHSEAKKFYEEANELLSGLSKYNYEAPYYFAWTLLEEAELLSKQENHNKAIMQYEHTKMNFYEAITLLESTLDKTKEKLEIERIKKLAKVARVRMNYCSARINLEKARLLEKQGDNLAAAENFATAASIFKNLWDVFKTESERVELKAIYYLCRAWETMALAEKYEDSKRFAQASDLFKNASGIFIESKLKLLASGNSSFCKALELGCKFDKSLEMEFKEGLYPKVKILLRAAASSYRKGGFESGADWALATSIYFDAAWYIIKADMETSLEEKKKLLEIASKLLKSASELFEKADYKHKKNEVLDRLESLKKEDKIIVSALNTIKKPSMSSSTLGIIAPACPSETSSPSKLSEIRQFTEEETKGVERKSAQRKYKIIYKDLLKEYPKIQSRECRIGIAQIGISKTGDLLNDLYEVKSTGLLGIKDEKIEYVKSIVKKIIKKANKSNVDVLIFPEMTIDLNYMDFLEDLSNLSKIHSMYIIPGSYHDTATYRNISMVIGPEGILWEQEKHIPAIMHINGNKIKEAIKGNSLPKKTIVCNTEFGRIVIVICRDFLDMDLRVELKNFEPPVDIVINPAFTPVTADFKAAHFDARRSIYAYCFFANVAEFGDSLIYTPEKDRTERRIPAKQEGLIFKDIDLFKLRSERKKWEKKQKNETKFIQSTR